MSNNIFINNDDIIELVYKGDQNQEISRKMLADAQAIIAKQKAANKRVLLLLDLQNMGKLDYESRKIGFQGMLQLEYDKIACYGQSRVLGFIINFMIKASGKGDQIKLMASREEAVNWLKQTSTAG